MTNKKTAGLNFWCDFNDWGPFSDGHTFETGLVFDGPVAFEDRPNGYGGVSPHPVGRFAKARRFTKGTRTRLELTSDWEIREPLKNSAPSVAGHAARSYNAAK